MYWLRWFLAESGAEGDLRSLRGAADCQFCARFSSTHRVDEPADAWYSMQRIEVLTGWPHPLGYEYIQPDGILPVVRALVEMLKILRCGQAV